MKECKVIWFYWKFHLTENVKFFQLGQKIARTLKISTKKHDKIFDSRENWGYFGTSILDSLSESELPFGFHSKLSRSLHRKGKFVAMFTFDIGSLAQQSLPFSFIQFFATKL